MDEDKARNLILEWQGKLEAKTKEIFSKYVVHENFLNELLVETKRLMKFAQDQSYSLGYHEGCEDTEMGFAEREGMEC